MYTGGPFPVTSPAEDDATLTCTITNSPQTTVRIFKEWAGTSRSTTIFVDSSGQAPFDSASVVTADGQSVSFDFPPSTQATIGELPVPPGYLAVINCGTGPRDLRLYRGGPFTVTTPSTPGGVLSCVLTNVQRPGPLAVLVLDKASNRRVVSPNQRVNFRITVRNRGRGTARNVLTCDRMPAGLRVVSARGARRSGRSLCWLVASDATEDHEDVQGRRPSRPVEPPPRDREPGRRHRLEHAQLPARERCPATARLSRSGAARAPRRWRRSRAGRSRPVHGLTR